MNNPEKYNEIKKMIISSAQFIRKCYWFLIRPETKGVRLICINKSKILLIKHSYDDKLYFPGGGINKNESPEDALLREIKEELSINISSYKNEMKLFGIYENKQEYKKDLIYIYTLNGDLINLDNLQPNSIEIDKFDFFDIKELPLNISPGTKRRVKEFLEGKKLSDLNKW